MNKGSGLFLTIVVGSLIIAINLWRKYGVNWWQELQEKKGGAEGLINLFLVSSRTGKSLLKYLTL